VKPALFLSFGSSDPSPNSLLVQFGFGKNHIETAYFRSPTKTMRQSGDVLFCLGILPAMELGVDLVITEPVDGQLLDNGDAIQAQMLEWYPWYHRVNILAERGQSSDPGLHGSGLFFSGGVDSSYSLAVESRRLDALVTIAGIVAGVEIEEHALLMKSNLEHAASAFNLEPIIVETNIRELSDRLIGWLEYYGSLLASIRHMLADHLDNQLIAATDFEVCRTRPYGSHPHLDPLFGTDRARIEHHGIEDRFVKIRKVAEDGRLLEILQVCYKSNANCGVCRKCSYLIESLDVLGKLDRAHSFPYDKLGRGKIGFHDDVGRRDLWQLRKAAMEHGNKPELVARIDAILARRHWAGFVSASLAASNWKPQFKRLKRQLRYGHKSLKSNSG
jgi:hypothetical protein